MHPPATRILYDLRGHVELKSHEEYSTNRLSNILSLDNDAFWEPDTLCTDQPGIDAWVKFTFVRPLIVSGMTFVQALKLNTLNAVLYVKPYHIEKHSKSLLEHYDK